MTMKYLITLIFIFSPPIWAADDLSIHTIKQMYDLGQKSNMGTEIIKKYSDASLKKAFDMHDKHDDLCGFDYDLMWQSQDPNYQRTLKFSKITPNKVKVTLEKDQWDTLKTITYILNCHDQTCSISDIYDQAGSVKRNILKDCN